MLECKLTTKIIKEREGKFVVWMELILLNFIIKTIIVFIVEYTKISTNKLIAELEQISLKPEISKSHV